MVRQPKWGHLKDVHKAIKLCEKAMLATDPTYTSLGSNLEVRTTVIEVINIRYDLHLSVQTLRMSLNPSTG